MFSFIAAAIFQFASFVGTTQVQPATTPMPATVAAIGVGGWGGDVAAIGVGGWGGDVAAIGVGGWGGDVAAIGVGGWGGDVAAV